MSFGLWVINNSKLGTQNPTLKTLHFMGFYKVKIDERSFEFALEIVALYKFLTGHKEYVLAKQILRSGTSIGANVQEAQAAQSRADFLAKMSIASKEARETSYWLRLLSHSGYLEHYQKKDELLDATESMVNIITKIVKTTRERCEGSDGKKQ